MSEELYQLDRDEARLGGTSVLAGEWLARQVATAGPFASTGVAPNNFLPPLNDSCKGGLNW